MECTYEYEGNANYMVVPMQVNTEKAYQMKMLEKNEITGFLKFSLRMMNNQMYGYYHVTSYQPLTVIYKMNKLTWEDVCALCKSIEQINHTVEEYLLDAGAVLFTPEHIYVNRGKKEIRYVYAPEQTTTWQESIRHLFDYILEHFDHTEDKHKIMSLYQLHQGISDGSIDGKHIMEYLCVSEQNEEIIAEEQFFEQTEENEEISQEEIKIPAVTKEEVVDEREEIPQEKIKIAGICSGVTGMLSVLCFIVLFFPEYIPFAIPFTYLIIAGLLCLVLCILAMKQKKKWQQGIMITQKTQQAFTVEVKQSQNGETEEVPHNMNFDKPYRTVETMQVEEKELQETNEFETYDGNTMLLSDYMKKNKRKEVLKLILLSAKEQTIVIEQFPCTVGSSEEFSDVCIKHAVVSKNHLCIGKGEEGYWVEDMNATNGTYLNEKRLQPFGRENLQSGDILGIANLRYKVEKDG